MKHEFNEFNLAEIELWEDNPRKISQEELSRLKESISRKPYFMNARPIVLSDRTGKKVIISQETIKRVSTALLSRGDPNEDTTLRFIVAKAHF